MIVLNNRDYNIVQSNCEYDFCHNRASLVLGMLFMYLSPHLVRRQMLCKYLERHVRFSMCVVNETAPIHSHRDMQNMQDSYLNGIFDRY